MRKSSMRRSAAAVVLGLALLAPTSARSESAPDNGRPFEPAPVSQPLYGIRNPTDGNGQRHVVQAADGVELFVETWLPAAKDGSVPPATVPTVLWASPYEAPSPGSTTGAKGRDHFVPRGYAYSVMHLRGTGASGGCFSAIGSKEIDDVARVIEYLGRDAFWSDGNVGMWGISYMGDAQTSVAGRGDPERTKYLKAIIPSAPVGNQYEIVFVDGVPQAIGQGEGSLVFNLVVATDFRPGTSPRHVSQRAECQPQQVAAALDASGDMTPHWRDREYRAAAPNVRAATLLVHGFSDQQRDPAPFFENLPETTPRSVLTGWWEHTYPDNDERHVRPEWARADFLDMATAWYDRFLKGLDTGVETWPRVQVQGSDGQWRAEPNWPVTGGPVGHLALGSEGILGAAMPAGSSPYTEGLTAQFPLPGASLIFETRPMPERLEITGQPVLDLWVVLDRPDAHVAARLDVLDAQGRPVPDLFIVGLRSARHLAPLVDNRFAQEHGVAAPVGTPIRVPVRFDVTDLVIPKGGRLRMTVGGSVEMYGPPQLNPNDPTSPLTIVFDPFLRFSEPSGAGTAVRILHDCEHVSALRFLMPRANPDLLNVREKDEPADQPLADNRPFVAPVSDAGGLATAPVCGQAPIRLENFGSEIPYEPPS
jgi:predicted acyl esterase